MSESYRLFLMLCLGQALNICSTEHVFQILFYMINCQFWVRDMSSGWWNSDHVTVLNPTTALLLTASASTNGVLHLKVNVCQIEICFSWTRHIEQCHESRQKSCFLRPDFRSPHCGSWTLITTQSSAEAASTTGTCWVWHFVNWS